MSEDKDFLRQRVRIVATPRGRKVHVIRYYGERTMCGKPLSDNWERDFLYERPKDPLNDRWTEDRQICTQCYDMDTKRLSRLPLKIKRQNRWRST